MKLAIDIKARIDFRGKCALMLNGIISLFSKKKNGKIVSQ